MLHGAQTRPVLEAYLRGEFAILISEAMLSELWLVCQRPKLQQKMSIDEVNELFALLRDDANIVEVVTTPPNCRDPKDAPVLATAIDGKADAIVTGDSDIRADDALRDAMRAYGINLWGITTLLERVKDQR